MTLQPCRQNYTTTSTVTSSVENEDVGAGRISVLVVVGVATPLVVTGCLAAAGFLAWRRRRRQGGAKKSGDIEFEEMDRCHITLKVVFVGESGVGKSR